MAISPDCNFVFLDDAYPFLAEHACIAESCVYSDPHTCIIKIGLLNEELCRIICKECNIEINKKDNFAKIVHKLEKHFFTDADAETCIKIHKIAASRNRAAHKLPRTEAEQSEYAEIALYSLCAGYWVSTQFYSRFVDSAYEFPTFHMPGQAPSAEEEWYPEVADHHSVPDVKKERKKIEAGTAGFAEEPKKEFGVFETVAKPLGAERKQDKKFGTDAMKKGTIAGTVAGAMLAAGPLGLPIIGALVSPTTGLVTKGLLAAQAVALGAKVMKAAGIMPDSVNSFFASLNLADIDKE